jgi:long-chain acyl-CoA synthetase
MGGYAERPWISRYERGKPFDITPDFVDALSMFRSSVNRDPVAPLIRYFDTPLAFERIASESDALAVGLAERGVSQGDRVAVYMQNVPQFVVALLATWKLGAIAVPVNPMLKSRELRYVLEDSGSMAMISLDDLWVAVGAEAVRGTKVSAMITTSPLDYLEQDVPEALASVERMQTPGTEDFVDVVRRHAGECPDDVSLSGDDLALLTYTSGTTGPPKGAMNTHGGIAFNSQSYRDWMSLTSDDVVLAGAPFFHITGLIGHIGVAMLVAAPMVVSYRFHAPTINKLAERHRCTFTVMAITAYTAMMNDPSIRFCDLSSLSTCYSGGAPIAPSVVERFQREAGPYIHNIYGLTETTSPSHAVPFGTKAPVDPVSGALSIGVPIFGTVSRVVNDAGEDVRPGEIGEIAIRGPQVVPGYWRNKSATENALPAGELRTGDVGFMDEDGWFYVVDRKKDMIVAAGYKVWPREVEDVLIEHDAVREAAVVGMPDEYRGETVMAFVSLRPGCKATSDELIRFCKERMAAYKYPRTVEILTELPKTSTGKLLRRELRERTLAKSASCSAGGELA